MTHIDNKQQQLLSALQALQQEDLNIILDKLRPKSVEVQQQVEETYLERIACAILNVLTLSVFLQICAFGVLLYKTMPAGQ